MLVKHSIYDATIIGIAIKINYMYMSTQDQSHELLNSSKEAYIVNTRVVKVVCCILFIAFPEIRRVLKSKLGKDGYKAR